MTSIGNRVITEVVKQRIARAVNVNDQPAKPLSQHGRGRQRYFYVKKAKGKNPQRDLVFTGRMMSDVAVVAAKSGEVRIGFRSPRESMKAAMNQRRESMLWFSPEDQRKIGQIVREEIAAEAAEVVGMEAADWNKPSGPGVGRDAVTGRFTSGRVA